VSVQTQTPLNVQPPRLRDLFQTGPGTLAGRYLRMFWQPVYRSEDLATGQAAPIRVMSEDLTLYRGQSGKPQVAAFRCAHRGTQLSMGWVEDDCIRCRYHGWKYDQTGQCVEQPGEDEAFAAKIRIASYPTQEYGGLVWTYLGEGDPPPFRRFPDLECDMVVELGPVEIWPCNYFNRMDNICDHHHTVFTHRESMTRTGRADQLKTRQVVLRETDYGIKSQVLVPGRPPVTHHFYMPNVNLIRARGRVDASFGGTPPPHIDRFFWHVPIDDDNCVTYSVDVVPLWGEDAEAFRRRRREDVAAEMALAYQLGDAVLAGKMRIEDIDPGISTYTLFLIEDYVTQVGLGKIDTSKEHLGRIDVGGLLLRNIWLRELRALAEGQPLTQWTTPGGLTDQTE
jgi:5,5'-dehydrodivanillate O-demethylase